MLKLPDLYFGTFIKRYKRFFVDITFNNKTITIHNPNTGSMKPLLEKGRKVVFSMSENEKRKLKYTMEGIEVDNHWLYTNTIAVNKIVEYAIIDKEIAEFESYTEIKREFRYKDSRIDFLITLGDSTKVLCEVKNVTMFDDKYAYFPDAVTTRGLKHLLTLAKSKNDGYKPVMLYIIQSNNDSFRCADFIDEVYCKTLRNLGNEINVLIYKNIFDPQGRTCRLSKLNYTQL
jgi:sugar fermentation stimulation protein A